MNDLLPTPEGELIRQARDLMIPKLSIRAAAMRAGISPEHWGNVERGHKSMGGGVPPRPFSAPAALLAKMAAAVGVPADRVETAGKRPDAAKIMRSAEPPVSEDVGTPVKISDPAGGELTFVIYGDLERGIWALDFIPELERVNEIMSLRNVKARYLGERDRKRGIA
jgi:hypothetical protein